MGLSPELFKRLSRLNRQLAREGLTTGDRVDSGGGSGSAGAAAWSVPLAEAIPGEEVETAAGRYYRVRRGAGSLEQRPREGEADARVDLRREYERTFFGMGRAAGPEALDASVRPLVSSDPSRIVYLDIESCGLAGEPVFLVGLLGWREGGLVVDQMLARDYSEEAAMLSAVWDEVSRAECLVTFNGKSFDLPTIATRSTACGLFELPAAPAHVDLLHEARRRWGGEVPNCRLQTLEQCILGQYRRGDIPGADIPAAYHEFVRSLGSEDAVRRGRSVRRMQTILHHNALDLLAMAHLAVHVVASHA